ncbi:MAG: SDR family oxidoreductase [Lacunisphaera sp.]|nr:SDR family oxidoreductase [Lacunisphaera sp.]
MNLKIDSSADETVLVTGANRGMGLGYVRHYLREGWSVIAAVREPAKAQELAALVEAHPDRLTVLQLDLESDTSIARLGQELGAGGIRLDLLINNAGVSVAAAFGKWTAEVFDHNWRVNVVGAALVAQAVAPRLMRGAKLVNISSGMGSMQLNIGPDGPLDAYAMTKAAINSLTRRLAEKLKPAGVGVFALNPGWVQTTMGGPDAPTCVEDAVGQIARTIHELGPDKAGGFFSATGEALPW